MTATGTEAILQERGKRYGEFTSHAAVSQRLKAVFRAKMQEKWDYLADDQKEALEMIAHKLGRIVNGDPNYGDSWRDIAGYAQLVADRLEGVKPPQSTTLEDGSVLTASGAVQNDPHAELRKTWKPGQVWQVNCKGTIFDWINVSGIPEWSPKLEYRRHPDYQDAEDASKPVEKPWIDWAGGLAPVGGDAEVEVRFRSGGLENGPAADFEWDHIESVTDIVAYKVVK